MLKARDAVRNLKEYHPPLGNREGLRLDFNENTVGCSPRVKEKLCQLDYEALARYPEREPAEAIVAKHLGVEPAELLLTNGTDEAIHLICETYLEPQDEVLIIVPTFAMFEIYAATTGAKIISIPAGKDFQFPLDEVINRITARTRLIAWANPNNPTGNLVPSADLIKIAKAAPQAALLIDEAYYHFCGETMIALPREQENLFVTRTFSKAYGLAGLRIGVIVGQRGQMAMLRRNSSPYNLNIAALSCLPGALNDQQYIDNYVADVIKGRVALETELKSRGLRYWPSRANFVLFYLGESNKPFIAAMRDHGILVRDRSKDPGCEGCVRVTLGSKEHNQRLINTLNQVFANLPQPEKVAQ